MPTSFVLFSAGFVGNGADSRARRSRRGAVGVDGGTSGLQPRFLEGGESVEGAILRERPTVVLIDCDHPDCGDALLNATRQTGAVPILFSPFRQQAEVRSFAARHAVRSFTLPTDVDTFGRILDN